MQPQTFLRSLNRMLCLRVCALLILAWVCLKEMEGAGRRMRWVNKICRRNKKKKRLRLLGLRLLFC